MTRITRYIGPLALVASIAVATPACAAQAYGSHNDYYRDVQRRAYDTGYREGLEHGEKDARRGRDFAYAHDDDYRDADRGYHRGDGDKELYRRTFRQGYVAGYSEGYRGAHRGGYAVPGATYPSPGGVGGPGVYISVAAQVGFRDGFDVGRDDARDRRPFEPTRSGRFRSADHDYDRRYGPRDEFQRHYRVAFERGYNEGYRQGR